MKFNINVVQNDDIIVANVINENNDEICSGKAKSPYKAVQNACEKLSNIMKLAEEKEDKEILKMIAEREKNDTGKTYTVEEAINRCIYYGNIAIPQIIKKKLKDRLIEIPIRDKAYREVSDLAEKINCTTKDIEPLLEELVEKDILIKKTQYICPTCHETTIMDEEYLKEILEYSDEDGKFACDNCDDYIDPKTDTTGFIFYDVKDYDLLKKW